MSRRIPLALLCCLLYLSTPAQSVQQMPRIEAPDDYFDQAGNFTFSFLRYRWRGLTAYSQAFVVNGLRVNSIIDGTVPFGAIGSIGSIATTSRTINSFFVDNALVPIVGGQCFTVNPTAEPQAGYATAALSNRTYSYRLSAGYTLGERNGWSVMVDASRRWGRSLSVEGVATDAWGAYLAASKQLDRRNVLQITAIYNPTERLMPSSSTAEAFGLAQNNLYNPAWGLQSGRQRSVNVRRTNEPIIMLNHTYQSSKGLTISSGVFVRFGENSYSGLNWQGAPNPRPDYYRYMPSAANSVEEAEAITQLWRTDVNTRQINFDQLYHINYLNADRTKYILEQRVSEPLAVGASVRAQHKNFSVGVAVGYEIMRNYKRVGSLLGGGYWLDVDSFVEQDEDVKDKNQNNVLDPNRHVGEGERFGYDYSMAAFRTAIDGQYTHSWGNFHLTATADVALRTLQREGYYEKENFPLGESYGASKGVLGIDYSLRLQGEYRLGTRLGLGFAAAFGSMSPTSRQQFISPRYRNALTLNVGNSTTFALEARANYNSSALRLFGSLYYYNLSNYGSVRDLYDDLQHAYVHYVTRDAAMAHYGVEASAEILLTGDLWLNVALNLSNNVYINNPTADIYKESTGAKLIEGETLHYKDLHVGGAPQTLGTIALDYRPYGWTVRLSAVVFDGGYVSLSPIRHTARAMTAAASADALQDMVGQEKLPAGISVDLFGGYTHRFTNGQSLGVYAGINNVLSNSNFIASGMQSDRFFTKNSLLAPQPSRYYYALPINFFVNLSFRF